MNKSATTIVLLLAGLSACSSETEPAGIPDQAAQVVVDYAAIVHATYQDTLAAARDLDAAVQAFVAEPSPTTLAAARAAWLDAREPYLQTEAFRFYDGPIDPTEGDLNAWPLDEAYIDYVAGDLTAGMINDRDETIDAATLRGLNEQGGEANIATGYHAIEFLLWGQDLRDDGPGDRPYTDYVTDGTGTAENQDRRGLYLTTVSAMLVGDLEQIAEQWMPDADNYRGQMTAASPDECLRRILTGLIVLTGFETGGERIQTALDSGDQEDEHSCFSDNTHRDMIQDIQGIHNVWHGSYTRLDGTAVTGVGMRAVVAEVDAQLAGEIDGKVAECLALANALQPPFDQEIAPGNAAGRARVQALAIALGELETSFRQVFQLFDLQIPQPE